MDKPTPLFFEAIDLRKYMRYLIASRLENEHARSVFDRAELSSITELAWSDIVVQVDSKGFQRLQRFLVNERCQMVRLSRGALPGGPVLSIYKADGPDETPTASPQFHRLVDEARTKEYLCAVPEGFDVVASLMLAMMPGSELDGNDIQLVEECGWKEALGELDEGGFHKLRSYLNKHSTAVEQISCRDRTI